MSERKLVATAVGLALLAALWGSPVSLASDGQSSWDPESKKGHCSGVLVGGAGEDHCVISIPLPSRTNNGYVLWMKPSMYPQTALDATSLYSIEGALLGPNVPLEWPCQDTNPIETTCAKYWSNNVNVPNLGYVAAGSYAVDVTYRPGAPAGGMEPVQTWVWGIAACISTHAASVTDLSSGSGCLRSPLYAICIQAEQKGAAAPGTCGPAP